MGIKIERGSQLLFYFSNKFDHSVVKDNTLFILRLVKVFILIFS
jgi:hypothetical protein